MKIQAKNSIETCTKFKEERVNIKPKHGKLVIKYHLNTPKSLSLFSYSFFSPIFNMSLFFSDRLQTESPLVIEIN